MRVPDRMGTFGDVVLGFDSVSAYTSEHPYFGSIIGRFANRIARGRLTLGGKKYSLPVNDGVNHLHGGPAGFHRALWTVADAARNSLTLTHSSPDGEQGYPGNLDVQVRYTLTDANELRIDYTARTDALTVVNLTNHAYFNLACGGTILPHVLQVLASSYLPVDSGRIPLGKPVSVAGTPFDFTSAQAIGSRIDEPDDQLIIGSGYDHTWVLDSGGGAMSGAAELYDRVSGRTMTVYTTQPGLQIYSGNFLNSTVRGKAGVAYSRHAGVCLETQHFPDSPNQPAFGSTELAPGQLYRQSTIYRFGTRP
jgi:aldose 1-epimerase